MTEQVAIRETERGKFALQHNTVTALIVGGFVVGSEVLESFIPVSGTVLSLFVAVTILVMLRPIQRLALRKVDRLMHNDHSTPAYLELPKLEDYCRRPCSKQIHQKPFSSPRLADPLTGDNDVDHDS